MLLLGGTWLNPGNTKVSIVQSRGLGEVAYGEVRQGLDLQGPVVPAKNSDLDLQSKEKSFQCPA